MSRFVRLVVAAFAAFTICAASAPARAQGEEGQTLVIGSVRAFTLRAGDTVNGNEMSIQDRIDHVQDLFAKYLGGQNANFTWKKWRDRVHIYMNGAFLIAVTPADANASGYKSAEALAPVWVRGLKRAFDATHVHTSGRR